MSNYIQDCHAIKLLVDELNRHRHLYYNEATPEISDSEYDTKFDELAVLEAKTGLILSNSPTQSVGYEVVSKLPKVEHTIALLSLAKTKETSNLVSFVSKNPCMLMIKIDGLTCKLEYEGGKLIRASTRGDGKVGEDVTHNVSALKNVPLYIPAKERVVITGEIYISNEDFETMKDSAVGSDGNPYKNARNLASGSIRLFDSAICSRRNLRFCAFNVIEGAKHIGSTDTNSKTSNLEALVAIGFQSCPRLSLGTDSEILRLDFDSSMGSISELKAYANKCGIPIDGLVASYDDVAYSKSLGTTRKDYRDGLAFKFEDGSVETVLREVEWSVSRSGELAPVAVFDTVELDGTDVSRATLHNIDFISNLNLQIGDRIMVSKRNMIIPHIEENLDKDSHPSDSFAALLPLYCPSCGTVLSSCSIIDIRNAAYRDVEAEPNGNLNCHNDSCPERKRKQLVHYVSKKAMDISGLGEETLAALMEAGHLTCVEDLYELGKHRSAICNIDGFGEASYNKLINAIADSRNTTMEKFIISMDIPELGRHASAILCKAFMYDLEKITDAANSSYDFRVLEDFGDTLNGNIHSWFNVPSNGERWNYISSLLTFDTPAEPAEINTGNPFFGKTVVATGSFESFTRDSINEAIIALGAKAGSGVSKNTDFLVAGEKAGGKKKKAEDLGVRILTEAEFMEMAGL